MPVLYCTHGVRTCTVPSRHTTPTHLPVLCYYILHDARSPYPASVAPCLRSPAVSLSTVHGKPVSTPELTLLPRVLTTVSMSDPVTSAGHGLLIAGTRSRLDGCGDRSTQTRSFVRGFNGTRLVRDVAVALRCVSRQRASVIAGAGAGA